MSQTPFPQGTVCVVVQVANIPQWGGKLAEVYTMAADVVDQGRLNASSKRLPYLGLWQLVAAGFPPEYVGFQYYYPIAWLKRLDDGMTDDDRYIAEDYRRGNTVAQTGADIQRLIDIFTKERA